MCGYFSIGLRYFMLKGKSLLHYINLFSSFAVGLKICAVTAGIKKYKSIIKKKKSMIKQYC